jgi:TldD protein
MKKNRICLGVAGAILLFSSPLLSYVQNSSGQSDPVLRAMDDELQRSVKELQFKDVEKPYFIQYIVLDEEEFNIDATFGAITSSGHNRGRSLQVQVRVGSYDFDNSEFLPNPSFSNAPPPAGILTSTVIEDDYNAVRHAIWLATDAAYKQAVEQLARKRAFVENKVREVQIPDFSRENATTAVAARQKLEFDSAKWEPQIREWSAIFREFPAIQQSGVSLRLRLTNRYLVNSEGTRTFQPHLLVSVDAGASVQSADGMRIGHSVPFNATSLEQLPSSQEIANSVRQLATDLTAVRSAPVLDADYSGPVLLIGQASAEMFARVLAPNLSGQRQPLSERDQGTPRSELVDRMNRPVLPRFLSVFDDPTEQRVGKRELIGSYSVDDQGVPARRVTLVQDGILKGLLMSRRPAKDIPQSNGHGRSGYPGRESAQIGNLFIQASEGKSYEDLKQELIKMCTTENLDYGLVIKAIDSDNRAAVGVPVLTYKVYVADGREELIRGASINSVSVRSLRQIEAVGSDSFVANRLTGAREAVTPVSVVAPSVLVEEMDVKKPSVAQQKPAFLTHPFFEGK